MEKYKRILKKQNGITLISLVVTIVILLILAGVTISILFGDDGIIEKLLNTIMEYQTGVESI